MVVAFAMPGYSIKFCMGGFQGNNCTELRRAMKWLVEHERPLCSLMGSMIERVYQRGALTYSPTLTDFGEWTKDPNTGVTSIRLGPKAFNPVEPRETVATLGHEAWHEYKMGGTDNQGERVGRFCARGYR